MNQEIVRKNVSYLGDSVYVSTDGFAIIITTENGMGATNEIYIEPDVLRKLIEYCERKGIIK